MDLNSFLQHLSLQHSPYNTKNFLTQHLYELINPYGGSVAEWLATLACWTQAQKGLGSNRSRDAVG